VRQVLVTDVAEMGLGQVEVAVLGKIILSDSLAFLFQIMPIT